MMDVLVSASAAGTVCAAVAWQLGAGQRAVVVSAGLTTLATLAYTGLRWMQSPWYLPGTMRRDREDLNAAIADENTWRMSDGTLIHHYSVGSGKKHAIYVHGGPTAPTKDAIPLMAERLGDEYTVHFYHQRGSGKSSHVLGSTLPAGGMLARIKMLVGAYGIEKNIADLEAIRRQLVGPTGRVTLIGFSFGGFLSTLYAAEFQGAVDKLVLVAPATVLYMPSQDSMFDRLKQILSADKQKYATELRQIDNTMKQFGDLGRLFNMTESELADFNKELNTPYLSAATLAHPRGARPFTDIFEDQYQATGFPMLGIFMSMGMRYDMRALLQRRLKLTGTQTLLIHCSEDIQREEATRVYEPLFPTCTWAVAEGVSHFLPQERPDLFASVVVPFLLQRK